MAQGDLKIFNEFLEMMGDGTHDMDTHTFNIALVSNQYSTISVATVTPALTDFTEVTAGGGYSAGGQALTTTWTQTSGTLTFATNGATITWTKTAGSPTDIRSAIIYNNTTTVLSDAAVCAIDMTSDGSTPISLVAGDITWKAETGSNRIFTIS